MAVHPKLLVLFTTLLLIGCQSQDIPQAHKGRMFEKTGMLALWSGGSGFSGPILGPGTVYTGMYPEIRMLDCSTRTIKEPLTSMTKDGVQFAVDVYVQFSANCDDDNAVSTLLTKLAPIGVSGKEGEPAATGTGAGQGPVDDKDAIEPNPDKTVTSRQVYTTFVRPALGEAARQAIASYLANDLNAHRDELFTKINDKLTADLAGDEKTKKAKLVIIGSLNLSNFKLPDEMTAAAADRATQQVLRDKSIAEQEAVKAATDTAKLKVAQAEAEAESEAAKIRVVGKALHENPEYYVRDVYYYAADKGGSVVLPQDPHVILNMTPGHR
jgi:SPFH domain / Band 7 family